MKRRRIGLLTVLILNWIIFVGSAAGQTPNYFDPQEGQLTGHAPALFDSVWDGSGQGWEDCSQGCGRGISAYGGFSFAFTKLHMKESFEAYILDFATGTQTLVPFDYDYEFTPRVWLGFRNDQGYGFRTSFWNFDHASNGFSFVNNGFQLPVATAVSVVFPATISASGFGEELIVQSGVKATTLDFEGTYETQLGRLQMEMGGGLRYARSRQNTEATVSPGPGIPDPFNPFPRSLSWLREFEGLGPLLSATGTMPIGNRGFYGVGGGSVSFLFGEKTLRRTVVNDQTRPNPGLPILQLEKADEISGIYAVRMGLGHQRLTPVGMGFVEGTYEGQLWTDLGAPTITFAGFNSFNVSLGLNF